MRHKWWSYFYGVTRAVRPTIHPAHHPPATVQFSYVNVPSVGDMHVLYNRWTGQQPRAEMQKQLSWMAQEGAEWNGRGTTTANEWLRLFWCCTVHLCTYQSNDHSHSNVNNQQSRGSAIRMRLMSCISLTDYYYSFFMAPRDAHVGVAIRHYVNLVF